MPVLLNSSEAWPTLTVNSRLARWRLLKYNETQKRSGLKAWTTPEILSLTAWLKQVWMQSWPEQHILTPLRSEKLWEEIVRQDSRKIKLDLLHLRDTARKAAEAYSLIQEYRLPVEYELFSLTEEGKLFYSWLQAYQQQLKTQNALDPASVLDAVHTAMNNSLISLPKGIVFAGFDEITPQFQDWLDFLKHKKVPVRFDPEIPGENPSSLKSLVEGREIAILKYNNKTEEAVQCSRWIRANCQPGKNIGIVVPDMKDYRCFLNRELAAELAPISIFPWVEKEQPFNISLGTSLAEEPMINVALQILSAQNDVVPLRVFTSVTKSPYFFSGQKESALAHELEKILYKNNIVSVFLPQIENFFDAKNSQYLIGLIRNWHHFIERWQDKKMCDEWGAEFSNFLHSLGWPKADNSLTSKEYQIYESWKECLDKFASLTSILGKQSLYQATETLTDIVQKHLFQMKTNDSPIQAVGLLESSGMKFDHLWVMGCHAEILPAQPSPNPFLPVEIRKRHNLPHSTAQRELEFAENALRRVIVSADNIVFSFPTIDKNTELKISPLLLPFLNSTQDNPQEFPDSHSHRIKDQVFLDEPLQAFEENAVLPVTRLEKSFFKEKGPGGGYGVIKDQAECPFRSFSNHRLKTKTVEFPEIDFDHRERGIVIHQSLENFWQETRSSISLSNLANNDRLKDRIESAVQKALEQYQSGFAKQSQFYQLEKDRIVDLIHQWLHVEMERANFEVINREKEIFLTVSGIRLGLRIDRIDQTADGEILLIDYKTGNIRPKDWFGDRIKEPQLPLYALQQSPRAILFGHIKKGNPKLTGAIDPALADTGLIPINFKQITACTDWDALLNYWRQKLIALADHFISGQTQVSPLEGADTCRNCGLQTLCRVQEQNAVIFDVEKD